ncbi:glycoside hydrolase family 3 C-terminal domain-containing protein [Reichenbachiella sp.]|uniref:glycoside hydrolase family 3 C-terminal domain-containing protein n=1 Tax=Reichenbachiella sp. TaxID=2184521 RepID=UPI0032985599
MKNTLIICLLLTLIVQACDQHGGPSSLGQSTDNQIEQKVDSILQLMTLKEKIDQISGVGFDTCPNERLGIPTLRMTDGPVGIRWDKATALPAAISLASSWDDSLMYQVGQLLGKEAKARGRNFFLGPCVNIHRFPIGGRNFESFGEDPYLAGRIAIPYIQGVQSENVLACVKHFACNNQEWNRDDVNAVVGERALHEIYLPAFKAAVLEGKAWTVMTSYNKVNGKWTAENDYLLNEVLKKKWGFKGFVVSDWGAAHSTAGSALAGLDLEMPFGEYYNDSLINKALQTGEIKEELIDDKIRRLLRVRFEAGMFGPQEKQTEGIFHSNLHKQIAYEAAVNGIVLLKNESELLPIDTGKVRKIAVIGPNAAFARIGGGGSSKVTPHYSVSPMEGLKNKLGNSVEISYALGAIIKNDVRIIENSFFENYNGKKGLKAQYFGNINCEGEPSYTRTDTEVNYLWYYDAPYWDFHGADDSNYFSVRWTGKIKAPKSGKYKFQVMHNDGARLTINGNVLINLWKDRRKSEIDEAVIYLEKGQVYDIQLDYYNNGGVSEIKLGWEIPDTDLIKEATELAKKSDLAILCIGLSDHFEGEGRDREFLILENQDKLIKEVVKANSNTIVVIISGTPPILETWVDEVPAIVQAWFAGQEGGNAIADILLGNRNPSGKLPCTFYKSQNDSPGFSDYQNDDLQSKYVEGIYVGYRYLDKHKIEARFPFGHGLSYSKFVYGKPQYALNENNKAEVKFTLTNTGISAGAEVAQLYIKPLNSQVERPEKELKAYKKVYLRSGESKEVIFELNQDDFKYYDTNIHDWQIDKSQFQLLIGSSSQDIRQTTTPKSL